MPGNPWYSLKPSCGDRPRAPTLTVELSRPPEVLVSRPNAVLGKKPPWSAPVGPPLPVSVNSMIALPPLVGVAAMACIDRSSCFGETYPGWSG